MGTTAEKFNRLLETKSLLKQMLTEKGIDVSNEDVFYNLAGRVGAIEQGLLIQTCELSIYSSYQAYVCYPEMLNGEVQYKTISGSRIDYTTVSSIKNYPVIVIWSKRDGLDYHGGFEELSEISASPYTISIRKIVQDTAHISIQYG